MTTGPSRLAATVAQLRADRRAGLIVYLTAGDPDFDTSLSLLHAAAKADMVEIGIPFSDPVADGPTLQQAHMRALASGQTLRTTLQLLTAWREDEPQVPAILMGYLNPILAYGVEHFMRDAAEAGADALILVDLPYEHAASYRAAAKAEGLTLIQMVAPTTDHERQRQILRQAEGFVYQVMLTGTTGATDINPELTMQMLRDLRRHTDLPVAAGFGVHTPEQAQALAQEADFVVVGSELVRSIQAGSIDGAVDRCLATVEAFGAAIRAGRTLGR